MLGDMKSVIVLAMHGSPPRDFPRDEMKEFFELHSRFHHPPLDRDNPLYIRYLELERKMRSWPRTPGNDPFWAGATPIAAELKEASGLDVIIGYNEFCSPTIDEALEEASLRSPGKIIVVTPMMTRGGEHSQHDIPHAIERFQTRFPSVPVVYAWPFEASHVGRFLAEQISRFT